MATERDLRQSFFAFVGKVKANIAVRRAVTALAVYGFADDDEQFAD
jgi:hypothetical protein